MDISFHNPDQVDKWLDSKTGQKATHGAPILDGNALKSLGKSDFKWYERIKIAFKEKNTTEYYQNHGKELLKEHNSKVIKATLKDEHNSAENSIIEVTSFLSDHKLIPTDRVIDHRRPTGADHLVRKLELIISFKEQLSQPWMKNSHDQKSIISEEQIDKMLADDSSLGEKALSLLVSMNKLIKNKDPSIDAAIGGKIVTNILNPNEFNGASLKVAESLVGSLDRLHGLEKGNVIDTATALLQADPSGESALQFLQDFRESNGLRQFMAKLDPEVISHPQYTATMQGLLNEWRPLMELPNDRFGNWLQDQIKVVRDQPTVEKKLESLRSLPTHFVEKPIEELKELKARNLADVYRNEPRDYDFLEGLIRDLEEAQELLKDAGIGDVYERRLQQEGDPKRVASDLLIYAQNIGQAVSDYSKISEDAEFKKMLSLEENQDKPVMELIEQFNQTQWNKEKNNLPPDVQTAVEQAMKQGQHYKEVGVYRTFKAAAAESSQIEKLLKGASGANNAHNIERLANLQTLYTKYGLGKVFTEKMEIFLRDSEIKKLSDPEKLSKWLNLQERIETQLKTLDEINEKHFQPAGLGDLFVHYTAKYMAAYADKKSTDLDKLIGDYTTYHQKDLPSVMQEIRGSQARLVDRLKARESHQSDAQLQESVKSATARSLQHLMAELPLDKALLELPKSLDVVASQKMVDQSALQVAKELGGAFYASQLNIYMDSQVINAAAYNAANESQQLQMMASAFAADINQQIGWQALSADYVLDYMQRPAPDNIQDPVSFQMSRLQEATKMFLPKKDGKSPEILHGKDARSFQTFLTDWEKFAFNPDSNEPQMKLTAGLYNRYQRDYKAPLSILMNQMDKSPQIVSAVRAKHPEGTNNLEALLQIGGKYFQSYISKDSYSPELIAQGMRQLIEQQDNLPQTAKNLGTQVSKFGFSDTEKTLHGEVFKLWIAEQAAPGTLGKTGGEEFLGLLTEHFKGTSDRVPTKADLEYAKALVEFATKKLLEGVPAGLVLSKLREAKILPADLSAKKSLADLNAQLGRISFPGRSAIDHRKVMTTLQQNPVHAGTVLLPTFVEHLLPAEEKHRVTELRKQFESLEPIAQEIPAIMGLGSIAGGTYLIASDVLKRNNKAVGETIATTRENLAQIARNNANGVPENEGVQSDDISNKISEALNKFVTLLTESAKIAHETQELREEAAKIRTELESLPDPESQMVLELKLTQIEQQLAQQVPATPMMTFVTRALPVIAQHGDKLVKGAGFLPKIVSGLGLVRTGMTRAAQPIINKALESALPEMKVEERALIVKSIAPMLEIFFLAGPELLKNHNVKVYVDYLKNLNQQIQSGQPLDEAQLRKDTWTILGQFLEESKTYTGALESMIMAIPDMYETAEKIA